MSIAIQNISLSIRGEHLVDIQEWKLEDGKIYGLTGKTGSGKSTVGKWLGRVAPIYWEVTGDMVSTPEQDGSVSQGVAPPLYLLQDAYQIFNPYVPVIRHFRDVWNHCADQSAMHSFDEILDLIASLGIRNPQTLMKRKVGGISQGEAQRLAFVLGFIRSASLRVYDEVFSNVDIPSSRKMLKALKAYCDRTGTAAVVISHEEDLLREFTEAVFTIRDGVLQKAGNRQILSEQREMADGASPFLIIRGLEVPAYGYRTGDMGVLCTLPELSIGTTGRVGLYGSSGRGKTTLLKGLIGEHGLAWSQCVVYDEEQKNSFRLKQLDIRYLPQSVASVFNPAAPVGRSIREIQAVRDVSDQEVVELLDSFGLRSQHLEQRPSQLSGGEIQRLGIISVLLGSPVLILLDESFSSVDENTRETIWSVLTGLQMDRKFALLVVSHDEDWLRTKMDVVYQVQGADLM